MGMVATSCCSNVMAMVEIRGGIALENRGSLGLPGYSSNIPQDGIGAHNPDEDNDGSPDWSRCPGYALPTDSTDLCTEGITGTAMKQPWKDDGTVCYPLFDDGNPATDLELCEPKFATTTGGMQFPPLDVAVTVHDQDEVV